MSNGSAGRVAIVTGAGGGLGKDYALALAKRGMKVVVNDVGCSPFGEGRDGSLADAVVREIIAGGGEAVADHSDISERETARRLVALAIDSFGRLDAVINNAGIVGGGLFGQMTEEDFDHVVDVSLGGTMRLVRAAWPHLVKSGTGRVVNITSHSTFGHLYSVAYATAKSGIMGFTRNLAIEAAADKIMVNCVMPSAYTRATAMIPESEEDREYRIREHGVERVTPLVVALASPECPVTGQVFHAGGALFARVGMGMSKGIISRAPDADSLLAALPHLSAERDIEDLPSCDDAVVYMHRRAAEG